MARPRPAPGRSGLLARIELLEDARFAARREPGSAVGDLDHQSVARTRGGRSTGLPAGVYFAAFSSRFTNSCSSRIASTDTSGRSAGSSVLHGPAGELRLQPRQRRADHLLERDPLALDHERARLEAGHVEQVPHQALQALGLLADGVEQLRALGVGEPS